jgi:hypothetical protein
MKIRPVGTELLHADRRTGKHDEVNSRFSQLCEGAKKRALLVTSKDVGLEVIVDKTKYTFMPREQSVGQNCDTEIAYQFILCKIFQVLENDINNQKCMHEYTNSILNRGNSNIIWAKIFCLQLSIEEHRE